jgi:hypothetical protein
MGRIKSNLEMYQFENLKINKTLNEGKFLNTMTHLQIFRSSNFQIN